MNLPTHWKTIVGWTSLILSLCCTAVFWTLPFSGWSVGAIASGILAAMLTGKALFAIAIYFLGKKYVDQLKNRFFRRKKTEETPSTVEEEHLN
jgi:hypothetical protein